AVCGGCGCMMSRDDAPKLMLVAVTSFAISFFAGKLIMGFFGALRELYKGFFELPATTYVPLSATVITAVFGIVAALFTQSRIRTREIDSAFREKKIEIYYRFLETINRLKLSFNDKIGGPPVD